MTLTTIKRLAVKGLPVLMLVAFGAALLAPGLASANTADIQRGVSDVSSGDNVELADAIKTVINILLFLVGAAGVIMVIVGGFRYVTSNGDSSSVTSAKNTILYAVVGIVVALAAFGIVNFVLDQF